MSSLAFLILITLSGLLLNHADSLGLSRYAAGPILLRIYGIEAPPVDSAFETGTVVFATSSGMLFANGEELVSNVADLSGAIQFDGGLVVATSNEFLLTTNDARLVERFAPEPSAHITKLGTDGRRVLALLQDEVFEFDSVQMSLSPAMQNDGDDITWSEPTILSKEQAERIGTAGLAQTMNWERVLIDLHSGRILPTVGRYIADIAALCLLYLCISGLVLWTRRR